ncbi:MULTISPECIES: hypothetical protein [Clostridium]|jgi:hypothetical protein|uniref:hypothetical protein n=1 Tax=Clostridium TaxID=1485 RepID=UPI00232B07A6|nr:MULTISPECIES: hypothetical protein [Clostridium]MDB1933111.1 hypothetical protein [Clostridium tertium]MDB1938919.1 hypothetical protein [Clostridium tertium]MDU1278414.1 hypothetical protein [Clostridium sp.]MDU7004882.1 hypothetical protein [Clostridium sp.]MDU7088716.1 hypothetical protein [Clostridium sp.]
MQLNNTIKMARKITMTLRANMNDRVDDCTIYDVIEDNNNKSFNIDFQAYKFYKIKLSYKNGKINWGIKFDDKTIIDIKKDISVDNEINLEMFYQEMKEQLEMRIPDKFLQANGWN